MSCQFDEEVEAMLTEWHTADAKEQQQQQQQQQQHAAVRGSTFAALCDLDVGNGKGCRLRTVVLKSFLSASDKFCKCQGEATKFI